MTARMEVMGDEGEWKPLEGITDVVIDEAPDRAREVHDTLRSFMRAYAEAMRPVMEQLARSFQAMRDAGLVDESGKPARRPDRPAWQSPYGPPQRSH